MEKQRLLELALNTLEQEKTRIEAEIADIQEQLGKATPSLVPAKPAKKRGRKPLTAKQKAAQSKQMKKYWADRKKKQTAANKTPAKEAPGSQKTEPGQ